MKHYRILRVYSGKNGVLSLRRLPYRTLSISLGCNDPDVLLGSVLRTYRHDRRAALRPGTYGTIRRVLLKPLELLTVCYRLGGCARPMLTSSCPL